MTTATCDMSRFKELNGNAYYSSIDDFGNVYFENVGALNGENLEVFADGYLTKILNEWAIDTGLYE